MNKSHLFSLDADQVILTTVLPLGRVDAKCKWISYVHIHLYSSITSQQRIPSTLDAINCNYTQPYQDFKELQLCPVDYPNLLTKRFIDVHYSNFEKVTNSSNEK